MLSKVIVVTRKVSVSLFKSNSPFMFIDEFINFVSSLLSLIWRPFSFSNFFFELKLLLLMYGLIVLQNPLLSDKSFTFRVAFANNLFLVFDRRFTKKSLWF